MESNNITDKLIFVIYLDIKGMSRCQAEEKIHYLQNQLITDYPEILHYIFPSNYDKVECINPKLISNDEYIKVQKILTNHQELIYMCNQTILFGHNGLFIYTDSEKIFIDYFKRCRDIEMSDSDIQSKLFQLDRYFNEIPKTDRWVANINELFEKFIIHENSIK